MSTKACCNNCAYANKNRQTMWCPFHDEPIHGNLVCDDFLDEYQAPQWKSLTGDLANGNNSKSSVAQFTGKDITAYVLSIIGILLSAACFLIGKV